VFIVTDADKSETIINKYEQLFVRYLTTPYLLRWNKIHLQLSWTSPFGLFGSQFMNSGSLNVWHNIWLENRPFAQPLHTQETADVNSCPSRTETRDLSVRTIQDRTSLRPLDGFCTRN